MSPLLLLIALPVLAALVTWFFRENDEVTEGVALASGLCSLVAGGYIVWIATLGGLAQASKIISLPYLAVDSLSALILGTAVLIYTCAIIYAIGSLRVEVGSGFLNKNRRASFFAMFHLFAAALFTASMAANPILFWIAIEATTLATVFCINFYHLPSSTEAAWKYLILSSLGLLLSLLGTLLFLLALDGDAKIATWESLAAATHTLSPSLLKIASVLVFIGLGTKLGLVPMHTWKPDAYSRAPISVVALFSTGLLNVALLGMLRFKAITDTALGDNFMQGLFLFFGMLSLVIAALIILTQGKLRRLFAYSSIENAGIMTLGIGFGGIAIFGALLHLIYHTLAKSLLFLTTGTIQMKYRTHRIERIRGVISVLPTTGVLFTIGILAIIGMPPFGLFTSELYIFGSGFVAHPVLTTLALVALSLVFIGMIWKMHSMLFGEPTMNPRLHEALGEDLHGKDLREKMEGEFSSWTIVPAVALAVLLILFGVAMPQPITDLLSNATTMLQ